MSSSLKRGTFIPPLTMNTTSQLMLSHTCYCTHCHTLKLTHPTHTTHPTPHTSHFAWHLLLFHIVIFIPQNRNLFVCILINSSLKTPQTPAEEIKMDGMVVCYSIIYTLPLTVQPLTFELSGAPTATG